MATSLEKLARRLLRVERQLRNVSRTPQLAYSSVEDGAIDFHVQGEPTLVVGQQFDGTNMAAPLTGPIPPTPSAPVVEPIIGGLKVKVDGTFADNSITPMDFARWEIHVSTDPEFIPDLSTTLYATIESPRGGEHSIALPYVPHYVRIVARTAPGKGSVPSAMAGPAQPSFVQQVDLDPAIDLGGGPTGPDGIPPASSPDAILEPLGVGALVASWVPVQNADPVLYDVYVSTSPITTTDPSLLLTTAGATRVVIPTLPGGAALPTTQPVYVRVMARDGDGPAAALGAEASATPRQAGANEISANYVYGGVVDATQIQTGSLQAILAILGGLTVGDTAMRHIRINPTVGFEMLDDAGQPLVHFPLSSDGVNKFTGDLVAQGFTALGGAQFRGVDNEISMNSVFELASGLTAPINTVSFDTSYREPVSAVAPADGNYLTTWQGTALGAFTRDAIEGKLASVVPANSAASPWEFGAPALRVQRVNPSNGALDAFNLKFMTQTGYNADPVLISGNYYGGDVSPVVVGTATERADMTFAGNSYYYTTQDPWYAINDGVKTTTATDYWTGTQKNAWVSRPAGSKSITIQYGHLDHPDYGDTRPTISSVKIWHYYADGRRFNNKVEISADGITWTTIFDSAVSGTYAETSAGKTHTFAPQKVLYVRDTLNGSSVNTGNHWLEIEAWGDNYGRLMRPHNVQSRPVRIGSYWYILYKTSSDASPTWRIGKFNLTGQQVAVLDYEPYTYTSTDANGVVSAPTPMLTTDGTSLIVGQVRPSDSHIRFQHFSVSGAWGAPTTTVISNVPHTSSVVWGLLHGSFDLGAPHYFANVNGTFLAYNASGQRASQHDWSHTAGWPAGTEAAWDGTKFLVAAAGERIYKTDTSLSADPVRAAFSWYDSDPAGTGTHETTVGPVSQVNRKRRYGIKIYATTLIPDAGDPDSPDKHRIYAYQGTAYTSTADLKLLATTTTGSVTTYSSTGGAVTGTSAPPVANSFPDGFAAQFKSSKGDFVVKGDGTGAWPHLENRVLASAGISADSKIATATAGMWSPGDLKASARPGETIPGGWLECKGQRVLQADYANLYSAIGFTYGSNLGDGSFPLPDFRRKGIKGASTDLAVGATGGAETVTLVAANLPPHPHTIAHTHDMTHDHTLMTRDSGPGPQDRAMTAGATGVADNANAGIVNDFAGSTGASSAANSGNGPGTSTPVATQDPYLAVRIWIKT